MKLKNKKDKALILVSGNEPDQTNPEERGNYTTHY